MAYATVQDVQARLTATMTAAQQTVCAQLLEDAAILIDSYNDDVSMDIAKVVSCRVVARAIGNGGDGDIPTGASQGSMSALGYSQTWTMTGGSVGEVYLTRTEKRMLGVGGGKVGSWSPVQELAPQDYGIPPKQPKPGKKYNIIGASGQTQENVIGQTAAQTGG